MNETELKVGKFSYSAKTKKTTIKLDDGNGEEIGTVILKGNRVDLMTGGELKIVMEGIK